MTGSGGIGGGAPVSQPVSLTGTVPDPLAIPWLCELKTGQTSTIPEPAPPVVASVPEPLSPFDRVRAYVRIVGSNYTIPEPAAPATASVPLSPASVPLSPFDCVRAHHSSHHKVDAKDQSSDHKDDAKDVRAPAQGTADPPPGASPFRFCPLARPLWLLWVGGPASRARARLWTEGEVRGLWSPQGTSFPSILRRVPLILCSLPTQQPDTHTNVFTP